MWWGDDARPAASPGSVGGNGMEIRGRRRRPTSLAVTAMRIFVPGSRPHVVVMGTEACSGVDVGAEKRDRDNVPSRSAPWSSRSQYVNMSVPPYPSLAGGSAAVRETSRPVDGETPPRARGAPSPRLRG